MDYFLCISSSTPTKPRSISPSAPSGEPGSGKHIKALQLLRLLMHSPHQGLDDAVFTSSLYNTHSRIKDEMNANLNCCGDNSLCFTVGGQHEHILNSDVFWSKDAAHSVVPLSFTVLLPALLPMLLQLPVRDGSTLESVPAFAVSQ